MAPHILLLSFPMQGHIMPLMQLAHRLISNYDVLISFVIPDSLASSTGKDDSGSLRIVKVPDGLPPADSSNQSDFAVQERAMQGMRTPVEELLRSRRIATATPSGGGESLPPISIIISDVFVIWSYDVAASFSLPLVAFFTANATSCSVLYHTRPLLNQGVLPLGRSGHPNDEPLNSIPGVPPLSPKDLPPSMQQNESDHRFQFSLSLFEHIHDCECLLLNTVYELEEKAIDVLRQKFPVYTIGPLLLPTTKEEKSTAETGVSFWKEEEECLAWVDKHPPASIIYVSFGSIAKFTGTGQLRELALGLEASDQPFLWVVRQDALDPGTSMEEAMPEGFLTRTQTQGMIVSWAPQVQLLSHAAVGGFVTHCGWNSILENISIAGVPMVCWPDKADQMVNRRMVVDEWGMGIGVEMGEDGVVGRQEIKRVVQEVLLSAEGQRMRHQAAHLTKVVRKAVEEGGSSFCNLESFIHRAEKGKEG